MLCAAGRRKSLEGMIPAVATEKPESYAKKWRKIHYALDAGVGGARCYNCGQTKPGSVPASTQMGNVG